MTTPRDALLTFNFGPFNFLTSLPAAPPQRVLTLLLLLPLAALLPACQTSTDRDRAALATGFSDYSAHQFIPAEQAANNYITKFPKDPHLDEAYYLRGISRLGRNDRTGGADDLRHAIALTERWDLRAKSNRTLADLSYNDGHYQLAVDYYYQSLQNSQDAVPEVLVLYRLGASLQSLGQWDQARPYLQRAADMAATSAATASDRNLRQRIVSRLNARSFSLQFAAFRDAPKADEQVKALARLGIQAAVVKEVRDNQWLYLVRAGSFSTHVEAESAARTLLAKQPGLTIVP